MPMIGELMMKTLAEIEQNLGSPQKALEVHARALEARADFMDALPPEMRVAAMREVEQAIDLCESPIEQVALYCLAGCNYGNEEFPARARVLRQRGSIGHYPDRIHLIPQVTFGRFRVDFLFDLDSSLIAVECDGADYHQDKDKDRRRDEALKRDYGVTVFRASGRSIWRDNELMQLIGAAVSRRMW